MGPNPLRCKCASRESCIPQLWAEQKGMRLMESRSEGGALGTLCLGVLSGKVHRATTITAVMAYHAVEIFINCSRQL